VEIYQSCNLHKTLFGPKMDFFGSQHVQPVKRLDNVLSLPPIETITLPCFPLSLHPNHRNRSCEFLCSVGLSQPRTGRTVIARYALGVSRPSPARPHPETIKPELAPSRHGSSVAPDSLGEGRCLGRGAWRKARRRCSSPASAQINHCLEPGSRRAWRRPFCSHP